MDLQPRHVLGQLVSTPLSLDRSVPTSPQAPGVGTILHGRGRSHCMSETSRYTLVVRAQQSGSRSKPWGWEICRNGRPLPVRLREAGFKTEHTATLAGNVALREFLTGLAEEQAKPDC
jgi:hypothetical protein